MGPWCRMNWNDLRIFSVLAREGSLIAAGEVLDIDPTTVSRRISVLERELRVSLFTRSAPDWLLTAAGERILRSTNDMDRSAEDIARVALDEVEEIRGDILVTAGGEFLRTFLAPIIWEFCKAHPEVSIKLQSTPILTPINRVDADLAFRSTLTPPPDAIARKIGRVPFHLYAAETLMAEMKIEEAPIIVLGEGSEVPVEPWMTEHAPSSRVTHVINDEGLLFDAIVSGAGIGLLPLPLAEGQSGLVRLGSDEPSWMAEIWMIYHTDVRSSRRLAAFRDFVIQRLRETFSAFPA